MPSDPAPGSCRGASIAGLLVVAGALASTVLLVAARDAVPAAPMVSTAPDSVAAAPNGAADALRNDYAESVLRAVDAKLARFPPAAAPAPERVAALDALDGVLRDEDAPDRPAVRQFFHRRIEQAAREIRDAEVRSGATVWHIYNHGFVVRTASTTVCFDLVRARYLPGFALEKRLMQEIAAACDVLFVSHVHADHAESFAADALVRQRKPVVAPAQVGYREPLYSRITHLEPDADVVRKLPIRDGRATLEVVVYPGHQEADIDNNVVLVRTPDGITIAHTGDQWDKDADFAWIDRVGSRFPVDILLPSDWTYDIARMVRGFAPALVIPGHQNELGHEVAKRQPYLLSFERKAGSSRFGGSAGVGYDAPLVVLSWGESFHYEPAEKARTATQRQDRP